MATPAGEHAESGIHIALAPEQLTTLWGLPITNTLITTWVVVILLLIAGFLIGRGVKLVPGRVQFLFESLFGFVYDYISETLESREMARKFFPFLTTMFLFIFTANILGLLPIVGSVGFETDHGFVALFRGVSTDLNVTLMLALVAFFVIEITGIVAVGAWKYAGKFFNFHSVLGFFIGLVELFSEFARIISFSFRLFGNMFAGKVLLLVVMFFVPYFLPMPILLFEIFVGFIQAAIFALLTLFFIKLAIAEPH